MEDVLSLRLKFVSLQWVYKSKAETDVKRLKVKLMWKVYWKWVRVEERQEEDTPEEEGGGIFLTTIEKPKHSSLFSKHLLKTTFVFFMHFCLMRREKKCR